MILNQKFENEMENKCVDFKIVLQLDHIDDGITIINYKYIKEYS